MDNETTDFGRYRLTGLLGKGGMGQVFRAYDTETHRVVALKVLHPHMAADDDFKERFRREAHAAARLNDPHVVPIHSFGEIDGQLYVDMRLIDGRDLGAVLKAEPNGLDPHRAVWIIKQVAAALHDAHRAGLVHRDVKPSNILVTPDDFAYLIDFGIVRSSEATDEGSLTMTGFALGTIAYMSPEQLNAGVVDPRSDIYALTCVLFQTLTGRQPFPGDIGQKATAHVIAPPPRPSVQKPGLTPALDVVIARGMAKNPEQRYQTALELADAARAALNQSAPVQTQPPREPQQYGQPARLSGPAPRHDVPTQRYQGPSGFNQQPVRPPPPPWWRRRSAAIGAAATAAIAIVAVIALVLMSSDDTNPTDDSAAAATSSAGPSTTSDGPVTYGKQTELPFTEFTATYAMTVDTSSTVYVGIYGGLLKVAAGASNSVKVPLDGVFPIGLASGRSDEIYLIDSTTKRVASLRADSTTPTYLPFGPLEDPKGIAVGPRGSVYVTDSVDSKVLRLDPGSDAPVALPSPGILDLAYLAVDADENVYAANRNRVVKLAKDFTTWEDVTGAPTFFGGIAVDTLGNLYVGGNSVVRHNGPNGTWTRVGFTGLASPTSVAVDDKRNIYVVDVSKRVVMLPVE